MSRLLFSDFFSLQANNLFNWMENDDKLFCVIFSFSLLLLKREQEGLKLGGEAGKGIEVKIFMLNTLSNRQNRQQKLLTLYIINNYQLIITKFSLHFQSKQHRQQLFIVDSIICSCICCCWVADHFLLLLSHHCHDDEAL